MSRFSTLGRAAVFACAAVALGGVPLVASSAAASEGATHYADSNCFDLGDGYEQCLSSQGVFNTTESARGFLFTEHGRFEYSLTLNGEIVEAIEYVTQSTGTYSSTGEVLVNVGASRWFTNLEGQRCRQVQQFVFIDGELLRDGVITACDETTAP
jgi:hypothetical protein